MTRYIVMYHAPLSARERLAQATREEAMAGVQQWIDWSARLGDRLVDAGRPFGAGVKVTREGVEPADNPVVGISVLEAGSMDEAVAMVRDHHHLRWAEGCEIVVREEIAIPETEMA